MPNTHNCKNYTAHGGNETVIGGKLTFLPGAEVEGLADLLDIPQDATTYATPAAYQADSTATTVAGLKDDFNARLAKIRTAGAIAADAPAE